MTMIQNQGSLFLYPIRVKLKDLKNWLEYSEGYVMHPVLQQQNRSFKHIPAWVLLIVRASVMAFYLLVNGMDANTSN